MRQINELPTLGESTVTPDQTIRDRQEMLMAIDEGLGKMMRTLEEKAQLENTIIVFISDHGYWYGEHGLGPERRMAYEEGIRVPLLMRFPRMIDPAITSELDVLTLDLAPTLIELAGLEIEKTRHGRSLVPLLKGKEIKDWRSSFLIQYNTDTVFERMYQMGYRAIRAGRYKYIRYEDLEGMDELYDLEADPFEMNNIIDESSPMLIEDLNTKLDMLIRRSSR